MFDAQLQHGFSSEHICFYIVVHTVRHTVDMYEIFVRNIQQWRKKWTKLANLFLKIQVLVAMFGRFFSNGFSLFSNAVFCLICTIISTQIWNVHSCKNIKRACAKKKKPRNVPFSSILFFVPNGQSVIIFFNFTFSELSI